MKSKKFFALTSLLLTLGLAVGAVFLGVELNKETNVSPDNTKAFTPLNCDLDMTSDNPLNDSNLGINNNGPYAVPEYCPGDIGKFKISTTGRLFIYLSQTNLFVKINSVLYPNIDGLISTDIIVQKGDYLSIWATVIPSLDSGIGWINPNGDLCGDQNWSPISIQPLMDKAMTNNHAVIERQCWGDAPKGISDFDFDDFQIIVAVEPMDISDLPTATPTNIPSVDTPTSTPPLIPTIIATNIQPTDSVDVMDVGPLACGSSSRCNTDENCTLGNVCKEVSGVKRCVASMCLSNGNINDVCESDLCTAKSPINISKTVNISCVSGQDKKQLSYMIVLTNPTGNTNTRSNLTVEDYLDPDMKSNYVIKTSIPFGGEYNNGIITWNGLSLTPNGGRLEIKYTAIVPPEEYGKEYVNSVIVKENGIVRGSQTIKTTIETLPCTAVISDQIDMILLGGLMVVVGLTLYRIGIDKRVGRFIWRSLGRDMSYTIKNDFGTALFKQDKKDFEEALIRKQSRRHSRSGRQHR